MKTTLGIFLMMISVSVLGSQNVSISSIDSLNNWVESHLTDAIGHNELYQNAITGLELSKKNPSENRLNKAYHNLATYHQHFGQLDSALFYFNELRKIYDQAGNQNALAETHLETEAIYSAKADYAASMEQVYAALELYESTKNQKGVAICYDHISDLLYYEYKYQESVNYCDKAIEIQKQIGEKLDLALSYRYKASALLFIDGQLDYALETINQAIEIYQAEGETGIPLLATINGRGNILKYMKRYDEAVEDYQNIYDKSIAKGLDRYIIPSLANIGHVYLLQGKYKKALPYNLKAIDLMKASGNTKNLQENYLLVSETYEKIGDYKNAHAYYKLYTEEYSNFLNGIIEQLESEAQIKYETTKKDETIIVQENKIKDQRKTQILYVSIAIILIISLLGMIRSRIKIKKKQTELELSKEKLQQSLANLKATQTQLIQSEKMASLGELTAGIAHEIQNPLNFVNNFSEVSQELLDEMNEEIEKGDFKETKEIATVVKQNLDKIVHHGKRAEAIVKGMLQHSRSSSGEKEPTDINALTDEYLRLAYHGFRAKDKSFNAAFLTDFNENIGHVNVIKQDIGRVILNLITNAFYAVNEKQKLNPEGYKPTVTVSTHQTKNHIEIKVKDNGNGIPENVRYKIFQPFYTTKPTGQGTGLGLSLSYDIVKSHGGKLEVDTKNQEYSVFTINLPRV